MSEYRKVSPSLTARTFPGRSDTTGTRGTGVDGKGSETNVSSRSGIASSLGPVSWWLNVLDIGTVGRRLEPEHPPAGPELRYPPVLTLERDQRGARAGHAHGDVGGPQFLE